MLCVLYVDDNYNALMNESIGHICSLHLYIVSYFIFNVRRLFLYNC